MSLVDEVMNNLYKGRPSFVIFCTFGRSTNMIFMKYKLVVLDVDGTLVNSENEISTQTLTALLKIQQMGVRLVLASGRSPFGLQPLVTKLDMVRNGGYLLSYNGGQIVDVQTGETIFEKRIDVEMIPYIESKAKEGGFTLFTYHKGSLITNDATNQHALEEAELNGLEIIEAKNFTEYIDFKPCKCVLVSDDRDAIIRLEKNWEKRLSGVLDAYRSESYFLEVVPESIDKGNTLAILLEKLKIPAENVIAIGDGRRDYSMIQLAGLGIAMGNAGDSIKACADEVTDSNDNDGVAKAIQKHIISEIHKTKIPIDQLNMAGKNALMGNLGIQYTYVSEDRVEATMPVDARTRQPFGILHGGATLALAETVAGIGSMFACEPDEIVVGMQVAGNHVSSAHEGDTVRAIATIIHKGRSSHVWNVDVFTSTDKLVSSIRVMNSVLKKR